MIYKTFGQLQSELQGEIDMVDESIVSPAVMQEIINQAVFCAEADILDIYEDYFKSRAFIPLVQGQADYPLPANIFANKIRGFTYANGAIIYPIKEMKGLDLFYRVEQVNQFGQALDYQYMIRNDSGTNPVLQLLPASRETASQVAVLWYIRHANRFTAPTDLCDIPEFYTFVLAYAKWKCLMLDMGNPMIADAEKEMIAQQTLMQETLTNMIVDDNNFVESDMSFYQEHS